VRYAATRLGYRRSQKRALRPAGCIEVSANRGLLFPKLFAGGKEKVAAFRAAMPAHARMPRSYFRIVFTGPDIAGGSGGKSGCQGRSWASASGKSGSASSSTVVSAVAR